MQACGKLGLHPSRKQAPNLPSTGRDQTASLEGTAHTLTGKESRDSQGEWGIPPIMDHKRPIVGCEKMQNMGYIKSDMFKNRSWMPRHKGSAQSSGPGHEVVNPIPGDFILTHGKTWTSRMIRVGEKLRYWGQDRIYTRWNHAAIFVDINGDIVEALGGGVQRRNISVYKNTEYHVIHSEPREHPEVYQGRY